ncbi:hypothetical protein I545_2322 [Mycobacterium kansasii 662]|uniref:Uncharacterized protein n=2 Tax=Mycobacterium kansasii TaxID=1768 RepID=A0A1V3XNB1_MYCKA|nr:hypothetical protein I547_4195 [Mycobacterium kansasii 824]EUA20351.1 hypothetical protein I545_2322 [Mycobacterium kansasii 662]OOK80679.1 hypothetical protein BZL29_1899 [Mycobacterium kansasii]
MNQGVRLRRDRWCRASNADAAEPEHTRYGDMAVDPASTPAPWHFD